LIADPLNKSGFYVVMLLATCHWLSNPGDYPWYRMCHLLPPNPASPSLIILDINAADAATDRSNYTACLTFNITKLILTSINLN